MPPAAPSLVCRELRFRQFRNFPELRLSFPEAGIAVIGDNGSGKSNLLEGLYYLEILRSFRGAPDEQLVRFGAEVFHIRARFDDPRGGPGVEIAAGFEARGRRKRVEADGVEQERLADAVGRVGMVIFSPTDVALVAGSPAERRRYLDIVLSLNSPGYLDALQRYRQVLRQRNQALRDGTSAPQLAAWSEGLVEWGARVVAARAGWIARRAASYARYHADIGDGTPGRLTYAPAVPLPAADDGGDEGAPAPAAVVDSFRAELERLERRELERGMSLTGPHRDDFVCEAVRPDGPVDLRQFGSGGQQRTAAVALRLVEAETIREHRGREPLVLLDDIMAELDPGRSRRLLELMEAEERGQVILTAPKPSDVEVRGGALAQWSISEGRVSTHAPAGNRAPARDRSHERT